MTRLDICPYQYIPWSNFTPRKEEKEAVGSNLPQSERFASQHPAGASFRMSQSGDAMAVDADADADGNEVWVVFNDEKVVVADRTSVEELKKSAHMYVLERVPST